MNYPLKPTFIQLPDMTKPRNPEARNRTALIKYAQMRSKADTLLRKFSWEEK